MVLTDDERGYLERTIEESVTFYLPTWLPYFHDVVNRKHMQYEKGEDVIFGFIWGAVLASFVPTLIPRLMSGGLTTADLNQIKDILYRRSDYIRQKIYDSG